MSSKSTRQTVVYPIVNPDDSETSFLQPLSITVYFTGPVPQRLWRKEIPIEISLTMSEDVEAVLAPTVQAKLSNVNTSALNDKSESDNDVTLSISSKLLSDTPVSEDQPIPFLPLPETFDYRTPFHWEKLSQKIGRWLVDVDASDQLWSWGIDAFWLAFIGAYPTFPEGKWLPWNPNIPVAGQFIDSWLDDEISCDTDDVPLDDPVEYLERTSNFIWQTFGTHIALFHPFPLVSRS